MSTAKRRRGSAYWWFTNEDGRRVHRVVDWIDRVYYATHPGRDAFWLNQQLPGRLPSRDEVEATDITGRDKAGRRLRRPAGRPARRPPAARR